MITLCEKKDIPAPFEKLTAWADNFETEFVKWSPYHLECEMPDGIREGARVRFREIVAGLDYDVSGKIVACERSEDAFSFTFVSDKKSAKIVFEGERTPSGCRFTHTESFGLMKPVIGPVVNFLFSRCFTERRRTGSSSATIWCLTMIIFTTFLRKANIPTEYPSRS